MNKIATKLTLLSLVILSLGVLHSCKNKNPSVIKIFVRSASNELVPGAKVVIIADPDVNPTSTLYVDTVVTNESGFAYFNVQPYYDEVGAEENPVAYFDLVVKTDTKTALGRIRSRVHTTAVETVFLPN